MATDEHSSVIGETAFCCCRQSEGQSRADRLEVDEYGALETWPEGFFGEVAKRALKVRESRAGR